MRSVGPLALVQSRVRKRVVLVGGGQLSVTYFG